MESLLSSFALIFVSEIGDKTFLIAAVMAMSHSRLLVFTSALSALVIMTVLSSGLGVILPNIINKQYVELLASIGFILFGVVLAREVYRGGEDGTEEELMKVTRELDDQDKVETGIERSIWMQIFGMTVVAEWGDRSQIATVALAGSNDFIWVTLGGILGHFVCTGIAVVGGRLLAKRISGRKVNSVGAFVFLACGILGLYRSIEQYE